MTRKTPVFEHPVPPDTRTLPFEDEISRQAHNLWVNYGCPRGRDVAIWLEAERQLIGVDPQVNQQGGGAVPAAPLGDVFYPPVQPGSRTDAHEPRDDAKLPAPGADTGLPK